MKSSAYIWKDGELIPWESATVHVMAHALHYGTSLFEGIRCYPTPKGRAIFRLQPHIKRLFHSAKMYRFPLEHDVATIEQACRDVILKNDLKSAYIRPLIYRGFGTLSVIPEASPVETMVGAIEWGNYLGQEGLENGIDVCISSWSRTNSSSIPVLAKAGGHYLNAMQIGWEARRNGYDEGISVSATGTLSEGSAENLFLVHQGKILTPHCRPQFWVASLGHRSFSWRRTWAMKLLNRSYHGNCFILLTKPFLLERPLKSHRSERWIGFQLATGKEAR